MSLADGMVGRAAWVDIGVLESLASHAVEAKREAARLAFVGIGLALIDWLLPLVFRPVRVIDAEIPAESHAFVIPKEWAAGPATMWEDRIQVAAERIQNEDRSLHDELREALSSGRWREDWSAWATCVTAYHIATTGWRKIPSGTTIAGNSADLTSP